MCPVTNSQFPRLSAHAHVVRRRHGDPRRGGRAPAALLAGALVLLCGVRAASVAAEDARPGLPTAYRFHVGRDAPLGGTLGRVRSMAVGPDDTLYVVDSDSGRVLRSDAAGRMIGAWGTVGTGPGEFGPLASAPGDVAVGSNGHVLVADPTNGRVQRFTAWGAFLGATCVLGADPSAAAGCATSGSAPTWSMAIGPNGTLYVATPNPGRLRAFAPDGTPQGDWPVVADRIAVDGAGRVWVGDIEALTLRALAPDGSTTAGPYGLPACVFGSGSPFSGVPQDTLCNPLSLARHPDGSLLIGQHVAGSGPRIESLDLSGARRTIIDRDRLPESPTALAVRADGSFHVAQSDQLSGGLYRTTIALLGPDGTLHRQASVLGGDAGAAAHPADVAFGADGSLYTLDARSARVMQRGADGAEIRAWGGVGSAPGRMEGPRGLARTQDGAILVADTGNARVQRFDPVGAFVAVVGGPAAADGGLVAPVDVAEAGDGSVVVSDADGWGRTARIVRFDPTGRYLGVVAQSDRAGGFGALSTGPDGSVAALDTLNAQIIWLDPTGATVTTRVPLPQTAGVWRTPTALEATRDGAVLVAMGAAGILRIGRDGAVTARAPVGCGDDEVVAPEGMDEGEDGRLAVADTGNRRFVVDRPGLGPTTVLGYAARGPDGDLAFDAPSAVAAVGGGIVVADTGHDRLAFADRSGQPRGGVAAAGCGPDRLRAPSAVAPAPDGGVVAATSAGRIQLAGTDGSLGRSWGDMGANPPELGRVTGLLPLEDGGLVLADGAQHRLLRADGAGRIEAVWGAEALRLPGPVAGVAGSVRIARAPDGGFVALDDVARRFVRLDSDGRVTASWPLDERVVRPSGLAVAADGTLVVADRDRARLVHLAADGAWLGTTAEYEDLKYVRGAAVLPDGRWLSVATGFLAADRHGASRLVVFEPGGAVVAATQLKVGPNAHFYGNDVSVSSDGRVIVSGVHNETQWGDDPTLSLADEIAYELDGALQKVRTWSLPVVGPHASLSPNPSTVVAAPDGGLFVADVSTGWTVRLAADSTIARVWRTARSGPGGLDAPRGVAVLNGQDGAPRLFVADAVGHRIARFAWNGTFEHEWFIGPGGAPLWAPHQIAAAPDGTLWVADTLNHRAAHFAFDGTPLGALGTGTRGTADGQLDSPEGVAVLPDGTVIVADTGNRRLQAFAPDGTFLAAWRGDGPPSTALRRPSGLSIADDGTLWVADREADRVVVFGPAPEIGWHVQYYRDGGLLDGPVAAQWIPGRHLDLDWQGQPPAPGLAATGFSLRAERRAGAPLASAASGGGAGGAEGGAGATSVLRRLSLAVRGGMTFIGPHGQPPVVLAGDSAMAAATTVRRALDADGDWLRVDFAATGARPMVRVVETREGVVVLPFAGRDVP
ncbi:MAG: hypothetical protein IT332_03240 [Ardenticatenales bacterium]|nr:hypothetical protein [Ardenticatenales bacterium]